MRRNPDAARYRANLQGEIDSAALYRAMADSAGDAAQAELYRRLAAVEDAHAAFWQRRLKAVGVDTKRERP
ncbi:MAG TPA: ferritin family protein, partial [Plasticicumulans sp.]|nr:ferritin family protein [Plasticicumulans sp.]